MLATESSYRIQEFNPLIIKLVRILSSEASAAVAEPGETANQKRQFYLLMSLLLITPVLQWKGVLFSLSTSELPSIFDLMAHTALHNRFPVATERLNEFNARKMQHLYEQPSALGSLSALKDDSFIVGEWHIESASKRFLAANMPELAAAGFKILFLEGLPYEMQHELDHYFETGEMHFLIEYYCKLDMWQEYSKHDLNALMIRLLAEARAVGIRIVGLEILPRDFLHQKQGVFLQAMNYSAANIIAFEMKKTPGKWVALMGDNHVSTHDKTSTVGLRELMGVRAVSMRDAVSGIFSRPVTSIHLGFSEKPEVMPALTYYERFFGGRHIEPRKADVFIDASPSDPLTFTSLSTAITTSSASVSAATVSGAESSSVSLKEVMAAVYSSSSGLVKESCCISKGADFASSLCLYDMIINPAEVMACVQARDNKQEKVLAGSKS